MKKLLIVLMLFFTAVLCFAQAFDDLPFTNPDFMTWFQQEMSSLMKFQFENDINIPFFATFSVRDNELLYKPEYLEYIRYYGGGSRTFNKDDRDISLDQEIGMLLGGQIKINSLFYIPVFGIASLVGYESFVDGEWEEVNWDPRVQVTVQPYKFYRQTVDIFFGTGVNINTDKLKGGIYLGYGDSFESNVSGGVGSDDYSSEKEGDHTSNTGLKIAIVPLVDTSNMAYIGKVLSSVMGYLGMGNAVMYAKKETGDSKINAFMNTINAGLDFTFNKFNFGPLSLKANAVYLRGNYNLVAKADTYGLKLQGLLSRFPLGFSAEGGYKHFFSVSPYLEPSYPDTGYINASIFFPLKYFSIGAIYQYDIIYESKFIFAVSTNFLSGFYCYNPRTNYNKNQFDGAEAPYNFGARFRWGGWKAKGK
jgi:hypothetical protein